MTLTEGERWTRAELARLRADAWTPAGVLRFLGAAQTRSGATRQARPVLARQARRWMVAGGVAWMIVPRGAGGGAIARRRGLAWWAVVCLMLDWHLGMVETEDGRPVALATADALTLARAWLVPAVLQRPHPGLLLLGAVTDLADGPVARRTRATRWGRDLEGLVDACFTTAAVRGAARNGGLSPVAAALEQVRLAAGAAYALTVYFAAGRAPDRTLSRHGRATAPLRMAGIVAAGYGHRRLADGLLLIGSALAVAAVLSDWAMRRPATSSERRAATSGQR